MRVLTNETAFRREREREIESQAMSDNMIKLQEIAELKGQVRKLESMLKTETNTSNEYWQRLQKYVSNDPGVSGMEARSTFGGASHHPMIEQLENDLKIQQPTVTWSTKPMSLSRRC